jgi:outer membrane protein OmpA-like peptidoglycan-associated protein
MLAATRNFGSGLRGAANAGYRAREQRDTSTLIINDEIFAGLGAAYDLRGGDASPGGLPLELELGFAYATAAGDAFGAFNRNYAEIKPGASYDFAGPLLAFVASGFGVAEGFGTPDWRVLAGVRLDRKMAPEREPIPDTDRDGFPDNVDKCITEPEDRDAFEDHDGCPDLDDDKDGVPDTADQCRLEPEDQDSFEDENGCPDPDNDKDKILDAADKCPNEPEDFDSFEDDNGCPEADNDQDSVLDADDACPIAAGPVENKGCPWPDRDGDGVSDKLDNCPDWAGKPEFHGCNGPQLVKITESKLELLETILFATNRTTIHRKSFKVLDAAALVIKNHTEMRIEIAGHTDDRGSDAFNLKLSDGRAEAVKKYFVKKGVPAGRLTPNGYGESQPIADNKTALGRGKNRRVEFLIVRDVQTTTPVAPPTAPATPGPAPAPAPKP